MSSGGENAPESWAAATATPDGSCGRAEVAAAKVAMTDLHERWRDALTLALATPRLGLSEPLGKLQALEREADHLSVPLCLKHARYALVTNMGDEIEGLIRFLSDGGSQDASAGTTGAAADHENDYEGLVAEAEKCAPSCPELVSWQPSAEESAQSPTATAAGDSPATSLQLTTKPTTTASTTAASDEPLVVLDARAQVIGRDEATVRVGWRAEVKNSTSTGWDFALRVDFCDHGRETLDHDRLEELHLDAGETRVFTGEKTMATAAAVNVEGIEVTIEQQ